MSGLAELSRRVVLSFLAHPDDAEILCGGVLAKLSGLGWEVHIVTATPGDCGSSTEKAETIAKIRRGEGVAAAGIIGGRYHCLEERDVHVVLDKPTINKTIDMFREINPTLVLTHPRFDYMLDHEQVHLLGREAAFAFGIPNASPLPMPSSGSTMVPYLYYVDPLEGIDPYSGQVVEPTTVIDVSDVIDQKVAMLASHGSQREWLRAHHGMDEYIDGMKRHSAMRGKGIGVAYGEAFRQHLGHAFPHDDLLAREIGS